MPHGGLRRWFAAVYLTLEGGSSGIPGRWVNSVLLEIEIQGDAHPVSRGKCNYVNRRVSIMPIHSCESPKEPIERTCPNPDCGRQFPFPERACPACGWCECYVCGMWFHPEPKNPSCPRCQARYPLTVLIVDR